MPYENIREFIPKTNPDNHINEVEEKLNYSPQKGKKYLQLAKKKQH